VSTRAAYGRQYRKRRESLIGLPCQLQLVCEGDPADSADHSPPLSRHEHVEGSGCCVERPACMACQGEQARLLSMETKRQQRDGVPEPTSGLVQSMEWL
jgi:hypothetical protein